MTVGSVTPVLTERSSVGAEASIAGWLADTAAVKSIGEKRRLAARIRRMMYLLGSESTHHYNKTKQNTCQHFIFIIVFSITYIVAIARLKLFI
jgi:hypothetical protein